MKLKDIPQRQQDEIIRLSKLDICLIDVEVFKNEDSNYYIEDFTLPFGICIGIEGDDFGGFNMEVIYLTVEY